ncbi:hypothetical protein BD779DRAFT_1676107 [Infundibulicybe gibba]|nr:hypothetical protein BD779DRAFT_1676107 [Infundibulicybe gibba]
MTHIQSLEPALLRALALTPHLRRLTLLDHPSNSPLFTAAFIRALHPPPPPGAPLLPHLRRLWLSQVSDCSDGICGAMFRARRGAVAQANGVASLEWAHVEFKSGMHDRDQADMRELYAAGMQGAITLGY